MAGQISREEVEQEATTRRANIVHLKSGALAGPVLPSVIAVVSCVKSRWKGEGSVSRAFGRVGTANNLIGRITSVFHTAAAVGAAADAPRLTI